MLSVSGDFGFVYSELEYLLRVQGTDIHRAEWQAMDTSASEAHTTRELMHVMVSTPIPDTADELNQLVRPDQPWAEAQFQERVAGEPVNPGETYKQWPYHKGDDSRHRSGSPEVDAASWAYLAGFIDGEGCINITKGGRPRIHIAQTQRNASMVDELAKRFHGIGRLATRTPSQPRELGGKSHTNSLRYWYIARKADVEWVLRGVLPYLMLKREQAEKALSVLHRLPTHHNEKPLEAEPRFSHSYMERYWPRLAGDSHTPHHGVRYEYGDLMHVVSMLAERPLTRQAYLPVWFPEDTFAASVEHERVPCTIGYHFLADKLRLHVMYPIRSCDFVRHFRNDVFMTARLLQWVCERAGTNDTYFKPGELAMNIGSLHVHHGDLGRLEP